METYVESFKPHIMDVVFAWANGASFSQICKMTDAFEGNDSGQNFPAHRYSVDCVTPKFILSRYAIKDNGVKQGEPRSHVND